MRWSVSLFHSLSLSLMDLYLSRSLFLILPPLILSLPPSVTLLHLLFVFLLSLSCRIGPNATLLIFAFHFSILCFISSLCPSRSPSISLRLPNSWCHFFHFPLMEAETQSDGRGGKNSQRWRRMDGKRRRQRGGMKRWQRGEKRLKDPRGDVGENEGWRQKKKRRGGKRWWTERGEEEEQHDEMMCV